MTVDRPLTFGSLVTTDLGRLNIKHDDSEGTISNAVGDLTITNSGTGDTVIANQGSTGKIVLAPNETPGPNVNSGQVLISGTSGDEGAPPHLKVEGNVTASGHISASGNIISSKIITPSVDSLSNLLTLGDIDGSIAGVRIELNQSTNKVEVKNADLVVGVADSNIQSLVVTNHITASGNVSASGNLIANDYNIGSINFGSITSGVTRIADGTQKTDIFGTNIALREGPVTASGDISSSGEIFATDFHAPISINDGYHIGTGKPILSITDGGALNLGANHSTYQAAGVNIFVTGSDGSKGLFLDTSGNVTASGNISASGILYGDSLYIDNQPAVASNVGEIVLAHGSLNLKSFAANNNFAGHITSSGNISSSGTLIVQKNQFLKTTNTAANHQGDVVFFGGTTSMTAGTIYYYNSSGNWVQTDADAESSAKGLLAVALGTASDTDGMLLRGTVTLSHDPGTIGDVLYLSTTAGQASSTVPSGNTDIVRIVGYCLDSSNNQIWFNPDNTFVEVSA